MMGRLKGGQAQLFYQFELDDAVPEDHLVRKIDAALDLSWLRGELAPHYSSLGRPSIDPELMIRMLVVGYVFAIRSERSLCREVLVNLAYRWFCKLGIEDAIPDHSAFSRARNERFREGDVFRRVFERVVETCIAAGLVGGEGFAVDASLIQADANKQRSIAGQDWHRDRDPARSSRAVKEYTAESCAAQMKNPQNRVEAGWAGGVRSCRGKLIGGWYCFGDYDLIIIADVPCDCGGRCDQR